MGKRIAIVLLCAWVNPAYSVCVGKFPNIIADVCWSCIFPIRMFNVEIFGNNQLDANSASGSLASRFCQCNAGLGFNFGIPLEFWMPVRIVEVTRTPFCLVSMNGLQLDPGIEVKEPGMRTGTGGSDATASYAFYHAHWYINPLLHWLGVLLDFDCLERAGFDLAYVTELDPTWDDDALANIISPEGLLTANLPGVAACAADCAATVTGWPLEQLWWCSGCNGLLLPPSGNISAHVSGRQSSALLVSRLLLRLHRAGAARYTHSRQAACGPGWYSPGLVKTAYKMNMLHPKPQEKRLNRCCEPLGSSPELWGRGAEWPASGEDFVYLLFRKRHCCAGAIN